LFSLRRIPFIIVFLLITPQVVNSCIFSGDGDGLDTSQAEELQISGEIGGTRGGQPSFEMPRTGLFMEPDDTSWISSSVDIESANGEYLQIDEKVPGSRSSFGSSPYSAYRSQNSRYIQEYKGILFMSYTTYESSPSDT